MIFLGVFAAAGLLASGFGLRALWRDHVSAAWPRVAGQVTHSEIKVDSDADGTSYAPGISYRYMVEGRAFTGECISFGIEKYKGSQSFAAKYVRKYPVGAEVQVAYQEDQPAMSVLETGVTRHSFTLIVGGLGFAGFAAWFYLLLQSFHRPRQPAWLGGIFVFGFVGFIIWFGIITILGET